MIHCALYNNVKLYFIAVFLELSESIGDRIEKEGYLK